MRSAGYIGNEIRILAMRDLVGRSDIRSGDCGRIVGHSDLWRIFASSAARGRVGGAYSPAIRPGSHIPENTKVGRV